jgi:putative SOS response-associated peptidase YedK
MCGRVIQSSTPFRLALVEGLDVRDSRVHNYPLRWNGAPSRELLVIQRNHHTGELSLDPLRWGLIPYWCEDPKGGRKPINAKRETVRTLPTFRDVYRRRRCILPVDGFFEWKAIRGQKAKQPYAKLGSGTARRLSRLQFQTLAWTRCDHYITKALLILGLNGWLLAPRATGYFLRP